MKKRIIIAGPTASGKSSLAIELAKQMDGEIISVDSRQCYCLLDIGTAKPSPAELSEVPHHNISVLNPDEPDTVADFRVRAMEYADEIESRGNTVIFCGGSTLHLQSLIKPLDDIPKADKKNQAELVSLEREKGIEFLYNKLKQCDPEYAESMDGLNRQRIFRALDVWMQTGRPFSSFHGSKEFTLPEHLFIFALHHPRKELHHRISERTDQMIRDGLVEETKEILQKGYSRNLQSLQTVGYRQAIQYLHDEITRDQMVKDIKTATRRYAKRQITWLRRWNFTDWIDMGSFTEPEAASYIEHQVAADAKKG